MSTKVPKGWAKIDLRREVEFFSGCPFDSESFNQEQGYPLIRIRDLLNHKTETLFEGKFLDKYVIHKGDVLVGMDGDFNIVRWKGNQGLLNQRILRIRSKNEDVLDTTFFYYYIEPFLKKINARTGQTTVKHLSIYDFYPLELYRPKIEAQRRIAAILQNVDNAIDKTKELIEKYRKMKQGLMQDLLDKRKSILGADGKPIEKWELTTLGNLVTRHDAGVYKKADFYGSGRNIVGVSDLYYNESIDGQIFRLVRLSPEEIDSYTLKEGDLIYGESSLVLEGIARTLYVTPRGEGTAFAWHTRRIRVNRKKVDPQFLHYLLNHETVRRQIMSVATQTALTGITTADFFNIKLSLPDLPQQIYIRDRVKSIIDMIQAEQSYIDKFIKMKAGLMQDLLTGKVRVAA